MRIHSQTMIERELERRELLRRVAALREDLNRAYEPLNIVRPQFGNNVRPRIQADADQDLSGSGLDFLHFPFLPQLRQPPQDFRLRKRRLPERVGVEPAQPGHCLLAVAGRSSATGDGATREAGVPFDPAERHAKAFAGFRLTTAVRYSQPL